MKKRLTTSVLLVFLIMPYSIAQLSADDIIKKNIALTGFNKQSIHSFEITGYFQQGAVNIKMHMMGVLPDLFKMEAEIDSVTVIKCTNDSYSWEYSSINDSVIFKDKEAGMSENFYYQWTGGLNKYLSEKISAERTSGLDRYNEQKANAELLGEEKLENIDVYKLKLDINNKIRIYYIDKISFLILKIEDVQKDESTYYADYKKTGELLLPHRLNGYKGNILAMSIVIEEVKINKNIDKKRFNAPIK